MYGRDQHGGTNQCCGGQLWLAHRTLSCSERGWTTDTPAGYPALYGKVTIQVSFSQATGALTSTGYVANAFSSGVSGALKGHFLGSQANTTLGGAHLDMNGTKVDSYHMTTAVTKE